VDRKGSRPRSIDGEREATNYKLDAIFYKARRGFAGEGCACMQPRESILAEKSVVKLQDVFAVVVGKSRDYLLVFRMQVF
jgi:hypothetical protein